METVRERIALMPIREEIKQALKESGMTQDQLSVKCRELGHYISQPHISQYLRGQRNFGTDTLEAIAKVLGKTWELK